jgi:hypothetical protein
MLLEVRRQQRKSCSKEEASFAELVYSCPLGRPCAAGMIASSRNRVDFLAFMCRTLVQSQLGIRKILMVSLCFSSPQIWAFLFQDGHALPFLLKESVVRARHLLAALWAG